MNRAANRRIEKGQRAQHSKLQKPRAQRDGYDKAVLAIYVLTLLASAAGTGFTGYQAYQNRDLIRAALDANRISLTALKAGQRPWVSIDAIPISDLDIEGEEWVNLSIGITAKNYGTSPAINFRVAGKMYVADIKIPVVNELERFCEPNNFGVYAPYTSDTLFAGKDVRKSVQVGLRHNDLARVAKNAKVEDYLLPIVVICAEYGFQPSNDRFVTGVVLTVTDNRRNPNRPYMGDQIAPAKGRVPREGVRLDTLYSFTK